MSVSFASTTTTQPGDASNHGNPRSMSDEAMDIDRDGPSPPHRAPSQEPHNDPDAMDTTVASTSAEPADVKIPGLLVAEEAATHPQPSPPRVDPPRPHSAGAQLPETRQVPPLRTNPALTQNILSLYGLDPLVATVARTDPATGEKINKMRKSYEGQLKSLGLAGRNKAVKHDDTKGMGLSEMAAWPEEEWQNQKVMGKDVTKGVSETMMGKLGKAMQLQPGKVPDNDYWEDLLGIDKVKPNDLNVKGVKSTTGTKASGPQLNGARAPTATTASANASQPAEPIRARRTTKKRRYDDGSFEGYGEGYADDDMDPGYSSGESRSTKNSAGHRKRRKTKDYSNSSSEFPSRNNSFTAGPVGISAYGR